MGSGSQEQTHSLVNLLHLCAPCHLWVESRRTYALDLGLLVSQYGIPSTVQLLYRQRRWVLLGEDGTLKEA